MPAVEYALLPGTVPFIAPIHPGPHPGHAPAATQSAITETNRAYKADCDASTQYSTVTQTLKLQLLASVDRIFVAALNDDRVGYALVSCSEVLAHLHATYGEITPDQLGRNRDIFSADWSTESPIEELWTRTQECRRFALAGDDDISDAETVRNLLRIMEEAALLATAVTDWRKRPQAEWTLANFQSDFTHANNERVRCLTIGNTGHSAYAATTPPARGTALQFIPTDGTKMYYCWTHGLGTNPNHCSSACSNKSAGHIDNATAVNMQGGTNRIMTGSRRPGAAATGS
jgi:hypothetical protein